MVDKVVQHKLYHGFSYWPFMIEKVWFIFQQIFPLFAETGYEDHAMGI